MTGYTVHTGTSLKFSDGWDKVFAKGAKKKSPATKAERQEDDGQKGNGQKESEREETRRSLEAGNPSCASSARVPGTQVEPPASKFRPVRPACRNSCRPLFAADERREPPVFQERGSWRTNSSTIKRTTA